MRLISRRRVKALAYLLLFGACASLLVGMLSATGAVYGSLQHAAAT